MFRKIHFRLADKRFLSELNDAFGPIWNWCLAKCSSAMIHYPRSVFAVMVLSIGISLMVLAGDIFGSKNKTVRSKDVPAVYRLDLGSAGFYQGLEEISGTASKMRRNVELNQKIDTLLNKRQLTAQDSLWLLQALSALER